MISGKTPIGIVFDETNRLAVALTDAKEDGSAGSEYMYWSSNYCDIEALTNCQQSEGYTSEVDNCGIDGRANTDAILLANGGCSGTTYAANACNNYAPSGCSKDFCEKNKWFLPSMRDLANIYKNKSLINKRLNLLSSSGTRELDLHYWSSTEGNNDNVWRFTMFGGYRAFYDKKDNVTHVRPVVKY